MVYPKELHPSAINASNAPSLTAPSNGSLPLVSWNNPSNASLNGPFNIDPVTLSHWDTSNSLSTIGQWGGPSQHDPDIYNQYLNPTQAFSTLPYQAPSQQFYTPSASPGPPLITPTPAPSHQFYTPPSPAPPPSAPPDSAMTHWNQQTAPFPWMVPNGQFSNTGMTAPSQLGTYGLPDADEFLALVLQDPERANQIVQSLSPQQSGFITPSWPNTNINGVPGFVGQSGLAPSHQYFSSAVAPSTAMTAWWNPHTGQWHLRPGTQAENKSTIGSALSELGSAVWTGGEALASLWGTAALNVARTGWNTGARTMPYLGTASHLVTALGVYQTYQKYGAGGTLFSMAPSLATSMALNYVFG